MFKVKENKKLAKAITAVFALNTIGYTVAPVVMVSAAETQTDAEKKKAEEAAANKAAVQAAESYKAAVDSAAASTISLNDDDDDLQFLNKVISLCTQTNSKKTVADTYKELVAGAKDAQEKADANGTNVDAFTQKLLKADERVQRIANDMKNSGTINVDVVPEQVINTAKATYQKGIADKKLCEAKAKEAGKDASACVLSEDAKAAANLLMTKNLQQVNVTATNPTTTNATEKKGASTIKNTDSHYYKGEDGLWHEKTTEKTIRCKDGEKAEDGKCVPDCKEGEDVVDGKCVKVKCADGFEKNNEGKCIKKDPVCASDEELKDGACVKKESGEVMKCNDSQELKDGKCVDKPKEKLCAVTEELKDGACVTKTCAEGEELDKEGKCVKKCGEDEELKDGACVKKSKCPTNYVESNNQCCPTDHPEYNASTGTCVKKEEEKKDEGSPDNGGSSGGSGKILEALGALGAAAALLGGHGTATPPDGKTGQTTTVGENGLQYTFNYLYGKTGNAKDKQIHLFPQNSKEPIKFKLFQYRLPTVEGQEVKPKAEAHVMVTLYNQATKKWTGKTITIPLEIGKMEMLFPETTSAGGALYLPLKEFGEIARVPASTFGLPYYTMTVVADDGISGHLREFNIRYDFVDQKTAIAANPDKKLKVGTNVVEGHAPSIGVDGFIQGATWDAATETCQIHIEKGTFFDNAANESYTSEDAYTITSDRYKESGCSKIANAKGAAVHIDGLTTTDDGKGNRILSDKDATDAKIAIYSDGKDYINNGTEKYEKGILNLSDVKDEYQSEMTYYERRPANFTVTYADGHHESWDGYSSDGTTLYDTNGNELTDSQKAQEVSLVCKTTGNAEVCNEGVKFDACSANKEPDRLGMVCLFKKDGTEVKYSANGFDRNSVGLIGSASKHNSEVEAMRNTNNWNDDDDSSNVRGYFRGVVNKVGDIVKDFYGTITGTKSSTGDKQVTVDGVAGTENRDAEEKAAAQKQAATQKQEAPTMDSQMEAVNNMNSATKNSDGSATVSKDGKVQKTAPANQIPSTEGKEQKN